MYADILYAYEKQWGKNFEQITPEVDPDILADFPNLKILLFPPSRTQPFWIYTTLGMSDASSEESECPEVHLFSSEKNDSCIHALCSLIEFNQENPIQFGDIFNCETEQALACSYLLASFPLADGEGFPELFMDEREIKFIWLLPVTKKEKLFIEQNGLDSFEELMFKKESFDFHDWNRPSLI